MDARARWSRGLAVAAMAALVVGTLDPLEGFPLIAIASAMAFAAARFADGRRVRVLLAALVLVIAGVVALVTVSSLGGFGGTGLPWPWGLTIVPYPTGWLLTWYGLVRLLIDLFR